MLDFITDLAAWSIELLSVDTIPLKLSRGQYEGLLEFRLDARASIKEKTLELNQALLPPNLASSVAYLTC